MKSFNILALSLFLILSCRESTEPELEPSLFFSPTELTINTEEEGDLTLQLANLSDTLFGVSFRVAYDQNIVTFIDSMGFTVGNFFGGEVVSFAKADSGIIHLTITQTQGQMGASGTGDLCIMTFTGNSPGSSDIEIISSQLYFYDTSGVAIDIPNLLLESAVIVVQ